MCLFEGTCCFCGFKGNQNQDDNLLGSPKKIPPNISKYDAEDDTGVVSLPCVVGPPPQQRRRFPLWFPFKLQRRIGMGQPGTVLLSTGPRSKSTFVAAALLQGHQMARTNVRRCLRSHMDLPDAKLVDDADTHDS